MRPPGVERGRPRKLSLANKTELTGAAAGPLVDDAANGFWKRRMPNPIENDLSYGTAAFQWFGSRFVIDGLAKAPQSEELVGITSADDERFRARDLSTRKRQCGIDDPSWAAESAHLETLRNSCLVDDCRRCGRGRSTVIEAAFARPWAWARPVTLAAATTISAPIIPAF